METPVKYVPIEERSYENYDRDRADALVRTYAERAELIANDPNLGEQQKKEHIEKLAMRLGYILLTECHKSKTRNSQIPLSP